MFERFTTDARQVVVGAQGEARALGHGWIGTEHLLLAVLADGGSSMQTTLARLGITHAAVRARVLVEVGSGDGDGAADAAALGDLGIDLDNVRRRVEASFGPGALDGPAVLRRRRWLRHRPVESGSHGHCRHDATGGHLRFTKRAKLSLEIALRESMSLRSGEITAAHVVLGMLRAGGLAARAVAAEGVKPEDVRRAVLDRLDRAA